MKGKVYLVGAGPGEPELLTVKALRRLREAEAVLHDDLVSDEILRLIPSTAQVENVGKRCGKKKISQQEINFLMISIAESGRNVIRLKSGDPLIFGRAGEEVEALRKAGIAYEIVPGVTSVFGAAASVAIPLTHRRESSALVFITAHQAPESDPADWNKLVSSGATLVIYMPGQNYLDLATKLTSAGLSPETPVTIISRATTPRQQTHRAIISDLHQAPQLPAPTLLIVGEVVRLGNFDEVTSQFATSILSTESHTSDFVRNENPTA